MKIHTHTDTHISIYLEERGVASLSSSSELIPIFGVLLHIGIKEGSEEWFRKWRVGEWEELILQNLITLKSAFDESGESLSYLKPHFESIFAGSNFKYF